MSSPALESSVRTTAPIQGAWVHICKRPPQYGSLPDDLDKPNIETHFCHETFFYLLIYCFGLALRHVGS